MTEKKKATFEKNCKPHSWPKGVSGNPKGGHKPNVVLRKEIIELMREIGDGKILSQEGELNRGRKKASRIELVILRAYKAALDGNFAYFKEIMDRVGGRPTQTVRVENDLDREWLETFKGIKEEADAIDETENDPDSG